MTPTDARAVTLHPHWVHAVAHLGKRIENRNRPIPPALVGQRVAIHAGATLPRRLVQWGPRLEEQWIRDLATGSCGGTLLVSCGVLAGAGPVTSADYGPPRRIVTRAIVATAVLAGEVELTVDDRIDGKHGYGWPAWYLPEYRHHWRLADVLTLAQPVPVRRGQLGLWRLDAATVDAVGAAGGWG